MAQYKVPQDVEADDKLIGPFSFRQFVYLLIAAGLAAVAVALFQLFPLLAIIPVPFILLFLALALPLKKDQPMETYLAAIVSYYLKPRKRVWTPGQRESTILITAPKIVDDNRSRDLSQEEATHRLSFLADIVDSEGYAIKGASRNPLREDLLAEANATTDMFDNYRSANLNRAVNEERMERHNDAVREMREAINRSEQISGGASIVGASGAVIKPQVVPVQTGTTEVNRNVPGTQGVTEKQDMIGSRAANENGGNDRAEKNEAPVTLSGITSSAIVRPELNQQKQPRQESAKPQMVELANNSDFSVATIAKQANRIKRKEDGEVFISLH